MNTKSALDDLIESCRRDCYRNDLTYEATVELTQLREQLRSKDSRIETAFNLNPVAIATGKEGK